MKKGRGFNGRPYGPDDRVGEKEKERVISHLPLFPLSSICITYTGQPATRYQWELPLPFRVRVLLQYCCDGSGGWDGSNGSEGWDGTYGSDGAYSGAGTGTGTGIGMGDISRLQGEKKKRGPPQA